jgi:(p)ppGpp synthase/HD superfamily hydrolase
MSTLERAIMIAVEAHKGQTDKGGEPYVLHALRVMLGIPNSSSEERIVGVLHDVIEDCEEWSFGRLRGEGFSEEIIQALDSVTRREGESYDEFLARARSNPIGLRVKLADLEDNCIIGRIPQPSERDFKRIERYRNAIIFLRGAA